MTVKGDVVNNWTNYEVIMGLDKQEQKIQLATFRSGMAKECLQIFLNLKTHNSRTTRHKRMY